MTIQFLKGSVSNITAAGNNDILDSQNEQVVLPVGALVRSIALNGVNLDSGANLSVGWNSNNDGLVPASVGVTSALVNAADQLYSRQGLSAAASGSYALRLYSSADINGTVNMIISYTLFVNDF